MAEQLLDGPNVVPRLQHMGGEGVWLVAGLAIPAARTAAQKARCTTVGCM
jgi:hypothetical protein